MVSVREYLAFARAPYVTSSMVPGLLGTALAWQAERAFDFVNFVLTITGLVFIHFGVNLYNDYYDFVLGTDSLNENRSILCGGSDTLVEGKASPHLIFNLAVFSTGMAILCGSALMFRVDGGIGPVFWLMVAGFFGGYFYTAPPLKLAYRGWGEADIFLSLGVLPVLGAYYVQTAQLSWLPVIVALPISFLMTNLLWINQFPDFQSDRQAGKNNLVVRLGTDKARFVYVVIAALAYLSLAVPPFFLGLTRSYLLGMLAALPSAAAVIIVLRHHDKPRNLLPGQALSIIAHGTAGALSAAGLLV